MVAMTAHSGHSSHALVGEHLLPGGGAPKQIHQQIEAERDARQTQRAAVEREVRVLEQHPEVAEVAATRGQL
jgi:hypothetical protein